MKVLVDTHMMLWWLRDEPQLSQRARQILGDGSHELLWSVASSWEIAVKLGIGKLQIERPVQHLFADIVSGQGVAVLPIGHEHCCRVSSLPLHHRDPFDRMLIAQAELAKIPILTADQKFSAYDVELLS